MKLLLSVTGSCFLVLGCGGRSHGSATAPVPDDAAAEDAQVNPAGSQGQTSASDSEAPPRPDLTLQTTVWIGETDRIVTFPATAFDGGDAIMAAPGPNASTPPEKVILILNAVTDSVTGTIAFGDGSPPPTPIDPKQPYPPAPTKVTELDGAPIMNAMLNIAYWEYAPYTGFSYSLASSRLTGNLLNLAFVPAELWRDWCALQDPAVSPLGEPLCRPPSLLVLAGAVLPDACRGLHDRRRGHHAPRELPQWPGA